MTTQPIETTFPCPACGGSKTLTSYACPGFRAIVHPCDVCDGLGTITNEQRVFIYAGAFIRDNRVHQLGKTQREAAARLGIDHVLLSKLEHGNIETWKNLPDDVKDRLLRQVAPEID